MKRFHWGLIGVVVLCLAMVPMAGCGASNSDYEALQNENAALTSELASLQADHEALQADYDALQTDHDALQADYDALNADYEDAQNTLTALEAVYPQKYFTTFLEMKDWLNNALPRIDRSKTEWNQHLDLQTLALQDGYIWSVFYDRDTAEVTSCVIAGDSIYWVWLDGSTEWVGLR